MIRRKKIKTTKETRQNEVEKGNVNKREPKQASWSICENMRRHERETDERVRQRERFQDLATIS